MDFEAARRRRSGPVRRAYLRVTFGDEETDHERGRQGDPLSTALLGALALDPALLDPLRDAYTTWQARLEHDGIPAEDATLIRLAVDGWWTSLVLDLPPISPDLLDFVRGRLLALTTADGPGTSA